MTDSMTTEQLYQKYRDKVTRYISVKVQNSQDCEDLVSSVFLKIQQNISDFDSTKASVSTWIYTISRNTVIDFFRTNKIYYELSEGLTEPEEPETDLCNEDNLKLLADSLEQLDERLRDLIILHYFSGITLKEIAEKMRMSYSNAKVLHAKALKELRILFVENGIDIA